MPFSGSYQQFPVCNFVLAYIRTRHAHAAFADCPFSAGIFQGVFSELHSHSEAVLSVFSEQLEAVRTSALELCTCWVSWGQISAETGPAARGPLSAFVNA